MIALVETFPSKTGMTLGIYGSGGLGREILDLANAVNKANLTWDNIVFIDDFQHESAVAKAPVMSFDVFRENYPSEQARIVIATGEPSVRHTLRERVEQHGYKLQTLVHPSAVIGTFTQIVDGAIIQFGSFISCSVTIGKNSVIQSNVSIGHDSIIGEDTVISSFVGMGGGCVIGKRVYIGLGSPVKERTTVGMDTIIAMGSIVVRDLPDKVIAAGNPARPMKINTDGRVFG